MEIMEKATIPTTPTRMIIPTDRNHTITKLQIPGDSYSQMRATLRVMGKAIQDGAAYLPIRNHAAALATLAPPKDYFRQVGAIYNDFIRRWRYVKDPLHRELVEVSPQAIYHLVIGKGRGLGFGRGGSDCDGAAVGIGSLLFSIGFPIRLAVMAPPGAPPGRLMSHVFAQAHIPDFGWVSVDPVVYPKHGFAYTPPHSRIAFFDLEGNLLGKEGNVVGLDGLETEEKNEMETSIPKVTQWHDYAGLGDYVPETYELPDFRNVIAGFGTYSESMGIIDADDLPVNLPAEVEVDARGLAWSPIMEIDPKDYKFVQATGAPYHGMLAMSDDAEPYYWDQQLGFFKKLFKKIKRGVKKVAKGIKRGVKKVAKGVAKIAKKVIKKLPGGKYLLRLGEKLWKVSMKLVKPLAKYLGPLAKWATRLAPIAALVPGIGTAVAAAMMTTGRIAALMKKYGVKVKAKAGKVGKLKFKSDKHAKEFQKALKIEAKKQAAESRAKARRGAAPTMPKRAARRPLAMPRAARMPMMRRAAARRPTMRRR